MRKLKAIQKFKNRIVRDLIQFRFRDVYFSFILRYRIEALILYLRRLGIHSKVNSQYRSMKLAHRLSTAYHIATGHITIGALRKLENGKDKDGNIWYKSDWDVGGIDSDCASISKNILDNALLKTRKIHYAEEGYEPDSPYRYPNLRSIPVSRHVFGKAIDLNVDFSHLGGEWSPETEKVISKFGLNRPYKQEPWHFELNPNKKMQLSFLLRKDK